MATRTRTASIVDSACLTCGGSTRNGRYLANSAAFSWRTCPACDGLRTTEQMIVAAVRARHGDTAADELTYAGVPAVQAAAGHVVLQQFRTGVGGGGAVAPTEPWEHHAGLIAQLAATASAMAASKRTEDANRVRPWPGTCLSCPALLALTPDRQLPVCDACMIEWGRTHARLNSANRPAALPRETPASAPARRRSRSRSQ